MRLVRFTNIIYLSFAASLGVLFLFAQSHAADLTFSVSSIYDTSANGTTAVSHSFEATNSGNESAPDNYIIPAVGDNISAIKATANNTDLQTRLNQDNQTIAITIPSSVGGSNKNWSFSISYDTELLGEFGESRVLQVPRLSIENMAVSNHRVEILADLELGFATARGIQPRNTEISVGKQVMTFQQKNNFLQQSIFLLFGESSVAEVSVNATIKNNSFWWKSVEFALPPDTNQQQVLIESIEPSPSNIRLDVDGNIVVSYRLGPKQSKEVVAKALVKVSSLTYDVSSAQTVNEIDEQLVAKYTNPTENWQPQNLEVDNEGAVTVAIQKVNDEIASQIPQDIDPGNLNISMRSQGLKYSDMVVGELRSRGIPARIVLGKVFSDGNQLLDSAINHAWVEAYAPGVGWVTVDPVFTRSSDYFGGTDFLRVGLVLWGISDNRPPTNLDAVSVRFGETEFGVTEQQPNLKATKYIILPGISVLGISAQTPPGAIVDNAAVRTSGDNALIPLGSLAPLQTAQSRSLAMGGSAFSSQTIDFGVLSGEELLISSSVESSISFLVVIYEIVGIVLVLFVVGFVRYRRNKLNRANMSSDSVHMHQEAEGDDIEAENLFQKTDTEQPDELPEAVDPGTVERSSLPPENSNQQNDTIEENKPNKPRTKPPHSNLIQ